MSRCKKQNKQQEEIVESEIVEEIVEPEIIEEATELEVANKVVEPEKIIRGTVICDKLNLRKEADKNSEVLTIIPKDLILTICDTDTSPDFYKVLVGDLEGYCMKQFIAIIAE